MIQTFEEHVAALREELQAAMTTQNWRTLENLIHLIRAGENVTRRASSMASVDRPAVVKTPVVKAVEFRTLPPVVAAPAAPLDDEEAAYPPGIITHDLPPPGVQERRPVGRNGAAVNMYDAEGKIVHKVTYVNPRGDVIAARMTKLTGVPHFVDPTTGKVDSLGAIPTDVLHRAQPEGDRYDASAVEFATNSMAHIARDRLRAPEPPPDAAA
jgi:hypothetical protein